MDSNLCWLLVRLAILLGVLLVPSSDEVSYQEFLYKFIDPEGPGTTNINSYCNQMMEQKKMTKPRCKPSHTFLNAKHPEIHNVCGKGGWPFRGNLFDSKNRLHQTVCTKAGPKGGSCQYTGKKVHTRIRLACIKKLPVHFDKQI